MPITAKAGFPKELLRGGFTVKADGTWEATRTWDLELDLSAATAPEFAAIEAFVEALIPVTRYSTHPARPAAFAREARCIAHSREVWTIEVPYTTAALGSSAGSSLSALPTGAATNSAAPNKNQDKSTPANQRHPEIWFDKQATREVLERDAVTAAAVKNTAGDPYDPPVEVDRSLAVFRFRKWKPTSGTNFIDYLNYNDAINDAAVTILGHSFPTHTLRVTSCIPKLIWDTADYGAGPIVTALWEIEGALLYDSRTHKVKVLNQGKRQKVGGAGEPVTIFDKGGTPVADPVPLASNGSALPSGGTPVYQDWNGYVPQSFTILLS